MCRHFVFIVILSVLLGLNAKAQQPALIGKWKTPDKTVIEFYLQGETITGKQISTEHNKKNNNKVVARDLRQTTTNVFEGTVIDPKNDKEYKGRFIIDEVEPELELKVTWGLITFNEIWERIE